MKIAVCFFIIFLFACNIQKHNFCCFGRYKNKTTTHILRWDDNGNVKLDTIDLYINNMQLK